jgi:Icc-related predicted phosphoesterase
MKISYVSDLHLEFLDWPDFSNEPGGDVLLLAGDITTAAMLRPHRTDKDARKHSKYMKKFKKDLIDKYDAVYMVMGNHEHYNSIFGNTKQELIDGFANLELTKIRILDNDTVKIHDWTLVGATLWTDFFKGNSFAMWDVERKMNDYKLIGKEDVKDMNYFNRTSNRKIDAEFILNQHNISRAYIEEVIKNNDKVIVMTHHAPTHLSLNQEHSGNSLDFAYFSNLSDLILDNPSIKYWIHGHTHMNVDYVVGDSECRVLSNQRGYHFEKCAYNFTGLRDIELP